MKSDKKFVVFVGYRPVAGGTIQECNRLAELLSGMQTVDDTYVRFADDRSNRTVFFPTDDRLRVDQIEAWAESREAAKLIELEQQKLIKERDESERPEAPPVPPVPSAACAAELAESF